MDVAQETLGVGKRAVFWARWAVAVGAIPIVAALIAEIPFSKLLPAKSSGSRATSFPQSLRERLIKLGVLFAAHKRLCHFDNAF